MAPSPPRLLSQQTRHSGLYIRQYKTINHYYIMFIVLLYCFIFLNILLSPIYAYHSNHPDIVTQQNDILSVSLDHITSYYDSIPLKIQSYDSIPYNINILTALLTFDEPCSSTLSVDIPLDRAQAQDGYIWSPSNQMKWSQLIAPQSVVPSGGHTSPFVCSVSKINVIIQYTNPNTSQEYTQSISYPSIDDNTTSTPYIPPYPLISTPIWGTAFDSPSRLVYGLTPLTGTLNRIDPSFEGWTPLMYNDPEPMNHGTYQYFVYLQLYNNLWQCEYMTLPVSLLSSTNGFTSTYNIHLSYQQVLEACSENWTHDPVNPMPELYLRVQWAGFTSSNVYLPYNKSVDSSNSIIFNPKRWLNLSLRVENTLTKQDTGNVVLLEPYVPITTPLAGNKYHITIDTDRPVYELRCSFAMIPYTISKSNNSRRYNRLYGEPFLFGSLPPTTFLDIDQETGIGHIYYTIDDVVSLSSINNASNNYDTTIYYELYLGSCIGMLQDDDDSFTLINLPDTDVPLNTPSSALFSFPVTRSLSHITISKSDVLGETQTHRDLILTMYSIGQSYHNRNVRIFLTGTAIFDQTSSSSSSSSTGGLKQQLFNFMLIPSYTLSPVTSNDTYTLNTFTIAYNDIANKLNLSVPVVSLVNISIMVEVLPPAGSTTPQPTGSIRTSNLSSWCSDGYTGLLCTQSEVCLADYTAFNECNNNGIVEYTITTGGNNICNTSCTCYPGYSGRTCAQDNICKDQYDTLYQCSNRGYIKLGIDNTCDTICTCIDGYTGPDCSQPIHCQTEYDDASFQQCHKRGYINISSSNICDNKCTCNQSLLWYGEQCQYTTSPDIAATACHPTQVPNVTQITGMNTDTYSVECTCPLPSPSYCNSRGSITIFPNNECSNECTCDNPDDWFGPNCQHTTQCRNIIQDNNMCNNHGTIISLSASQCDNKCTCDDGWYGDQCQHNHKCQHIITSLDNCTGHGTVVYNSSTDSCDIQCTCHDNDVYYGNQCQHLVQCQAVIESLDDCNNHGTVILSQDNTSICNNICTCHNTSLWAGETCAQSTQCQTTLNCGPNGYVSSVELQNRFMNYGNNDDNRHNSNIFPLATSCDDTCTCIGQWQGSLCATCPIKCYRGNYNPSSRCQDDLLYTLPCLCNTNALGRLCQYYSIDTSITIRNRLFPQWLIQAITNKTSKDERVQSFLSDLIAAFNTMLDLPLDNILTNTKDVNIKAIYKKDIVDTTHIPITNLKLGLVPTQCNQDGMTTTVDVQSTINITINNRVGNSISGINNEANQIYSKWNIAMTSSDRILLNTINAVFTTYGVDYISDVYPGCNDGSDEDIEMSIEEPHIPSLPIESDDENASYNAYIHYIYNPYVVMVYICVILSHFMY